MIRYEYLSTVDGKGHKHSFKVLAGDAAPTGHSETDRREALLRTPALKQPLAAFYASLRK